MELGRHSYIGDFTEVFSPDVKIGAFSSLGGGIIFHGASSHATDRITSFPLREKLKWDEYEATNQTAGPIEIGNDVYVGSNVTFLDGVTVGDGAVIGAGSVLRGDYYPYGIYYGNPAKLIRLRFAPVVIEKLLDIKWWEWPDDLIRQRLNMNVEEFIDRYA